MLGKVDPNTQSADKLAHLQGGFSASLLDPERTAPIDIVGPTPEKKAIKRFAVYRNNVVVSLVEALMAAHPTVVELVGEEFFRAMARLYVQHSPPKSAMLMTYGHDFGDFIESFEPAASLPYLPDIARMEAAWLQAYHAKDHTPLDPVRLQDFAPEDLGNLRFALHPATRILRSDHPIYSIWAAHRQGQTEQEIEAEPQDILITRPDYDVAVISLPAGGATFLMALAQEATLAQAAEAAAQAEETFDFAQNLGGLLETGAAIEVTLQA